MLRRLRTFALWTGTLLCVLIVAAFVVSAWWQLSAHTGKVSVYVVVGSAQLSFDDPLALPIVVDGRFFGRPHDFNLSRWNRWLAGRAVPGYFALTIPLYALFAAVAIPTLLVWRFWPKPPKPGHCRCAYDLTGNTSGVCPECGQQC